MAISCSSLRCRTTWHAAFVKLLPQIESHASFAFRFLPADDREEAIQDAIALAFRGFVILMVRGDAQRVYSTPLARFAIGRVRQGRTLGSGTNSHEVLSRWAQRQHGFTVRGIHRHDVQQGDWREAVLGDTRTPVPDQAAFRIDLPAWLSQLSSRNRRIAESLACGDSTQVVARKFRVSPGRISQLRRELHESWEAFHEGLAAVASRDDQPRFAAGRRSP